MTAWVRQAWRAVSDKVYSMSFKEAGFRGIMEYWHIARHDVYDEQFYRAWKVSIEPSLSHEGLELSKADDLGFVDAKGTHIQYTQCSHLHLILCVCSETLPN